MCRWQCVHAEPAATRDPFIHEVTDASPCVYFEFSHKTASLNIFEGRMAPLRFAAPAWGNSMVKTDKGIGGELS